MIFNSDAANEYARTHIGFVDRQFGDLRQALASAYDHGWTAGRSSGLQEAIEALDAIPAGDPEAAHGDADKILLGLIPKAAADAWRRAEVRCGGFWYA